MFDFDFTQSVVDDGAGNFTYTFTITPNRTLTADIDLTWSILQQGFLPIPSSYFSTMTGMVNFASGDGTSDGQDVEIRFTSDPRTSFPRNFAIQVTDSEDTEVTTEDVTIDADDSESDATQVDFIGTGAKNVLGAITSIDGDYDAGGDNDEYVITRYQHGDVEILDRLGTNTIKFDYGVTITAYRENGNPVFGIGSIELTLSTRAKVKINTPDATAGTDGPPFFSYQFGDGTAMSYAQLKTTLGITQQNTDVTLTTPFEVTTASPVATGVTKGTTAADIVGSTSTDILGAGNDAPLDLDAGSGDDVYVITRHQVGDTEILDRLGTNTIKFDYGVSITAYRENGNPVFGIGSIELILSTSAKVKINTPDATDGTDGPPFFSYQFGDGTVMSYAQLKTTLGITQQNTDVTFDTPFTVLFPGEAIGSAPSISTGTMAIEREVPASDATEEERDLTIRYFVGDMEDDMGEENPITAESFTVYELGQNDEKTESAYFEMFNSAPMGETPAWGLRTIAGATPPAGDYRIVVAVEDSDENVGESGEITLTLSVNTDPTVLINALTITQGMNHVFNSQDMEEMKDLRASDTEQMSASELTYTLITNPVGGGRIYNTFLGDREITKDTRGFTQNELNLGHIEYRPGETTGSDSFTFIVEDGIGGVSTETFHTFNITIMETDTDTTHPTPRVYLAELDSGGTNILDNTELLYIDDDDDTDPENVTYTIEEEGLFGFAEVGVSIQLARKNSDGTAMRNPDNSIIFDALAVGDDFTQKDINDGFVRIHHNDSLATVQTNAFLTAIIKVEDEHNNRTPPDRHFFDITLKPPVNTAPTRNPDLDPLAINEGQRVGIARENLEYTDMEQTEAADIEYTLDGAVTNGKLYRNTMPVEAPENDVEITNRMTFMQAEINAGHILIKHDGEHDTAPVTFNFTVTDGVLRMNPVRGSFSTANVVTMDDAPDVTPEDRMVSVDVTEQNFPGYSRSRDGEVITFNDEESARAALNIHGDPEGDNRAITSGTEVDGDAGYGRFIITRNNNTGQVTPGQLTWYYEINNSDERLESLLEDQEETDTVTVRISDSIRHVDVVLTANITGANEPPSGTVTVTNAIANSNNQGRSEGLQFTDTQLNDMFAATDDRVPLDLDLVLVTAPEHGVLRTGGSAGPVFREEDFFGFEEIDAKNFRYFHTGSSTAITDTFTFKLRDGHDGESDNITFTITVNQAPTGSNAFDPGDSSDDSVTEDSNDIRSSGKVTFRDPNIRQGNLNHTLRLQEGANELSTTPHPYPGMYGNFSLRTTNQPGVIEWSYKLATANDEDLSQYRALQAFTGTRTLEETVRVHAFDRGLDTGTNTNLTDDLGSGVDITVFVTTANVPPTASSDDSGAVVNHGETLIFADNAFSSDDDGMPNQRWFLLTGDISYGELVYDTASYVALNNVAFTMDQFPGNNFRYEHYGNNPSTTESFKFRIRDGNDGESDEETFNIIINQAPRATSRLDVGTNNNVIEDDADLSNRRVDGEITLSDPNNSGEGVLNDPLRTVAGTGNTEILNTNTEFRVPVTYGYFAFTRDGDSVDWQYHLAPAGDTQYKPQYDELQGLSLSSGITTDSITFTVYDRGADGMVGVDTDLMGSVLLTVDITGRDERSRIVAPDTPPALLKTTGGVPGNIDYEINYTDDEGANYVDAEPGRWGGAAVTVDGIPYTRFSGSYGNLDVSGLDGDYIYRLTHLATALDREDTGLEESVVMEGDGDSMLEVGEWIIDTIYVSATRDGTNTITNAEVKIRINGEGGISNKKPRPADTTTIQAFVDELNTAPTSTTDNQRFFYIDEESAPSDIVMETDPDNEHPIATTSFILTDDRERIIDVTYGHFIFARHVVGEDLTPTDSNTQGELRWSYVLDNRHADLKTHDENDEPLTDKIKIRLTDGNGEHTDITLTATIRGIDEPTVIAGADDEAPTTILESATSITGDLKFSIDDDDKDSDIIWQTPDNVGGVGDYGTLSITGNTFTFTLNPADLNMDAPGPTFDEMESLPQRFKVRGLDRFGNSAEFNLDLTIQGVDLAPLGTIMLTQDPGFTLSVAENSITAGNLAFTLSDDSPPINPITWGGTRKVSEITGNISYVHTGTYGTLEIAERGSFSYDPFDEATLDPLDNVDERALDPAGPNDGNTSFDENEKFKETFTITATDENGDKAVLDIEFTIEGVGSSDNTEITIPEGSDTTADVMEVNDATTSMTENQQLLKYIDFESAGSDITIETNPNGEDPHVMQATIPTDADGLEVTAKFGTFIFTRAGDLTSSSPNTESTLQWSYVLNSKHDRLKTLDAEQTEEDTIKIRLTDSGVGGVGAQSKDETLRVTIMGANERTDVTAAAVTGTRAINEGEISIDGSLVHSLGGVESTGVITWETPDDTGGMRPLGTLTFEEDNAYTFTLGLQSELDAAARGPSLDDTESITETFRVVGTDAFGNFAEFNLVITINGMGTADPGTITIVDDSTRMVAENATTTIALNFVLSDNSAPADPVTWATDKTTGTYGTLTLNSDNTWDYTPSDSATLDGLADDGSFDDGDDFTDRFTITATDDNGDNATYNLEIIVNGVNAAPGVTGPAGLGSAAGLPHYEDGINPSDGSTGIKMSRQEFTLSDDDDLAENLSLAVKTREDTAGDGSTSVTRTYGTLAVEVDNGRSYLVYTLAEDGQAGENVQSLDHNAVASDQFTLVITDDSGKDSGRSEVHFTVGVRGVNDQAVLNYATDGNEQDIIINEGEQNSGEKNTGIVFDITDPDSGDQGSFYNQDRFLVQESDGMGGFKDEASSRFAIRGDAGLTGYRLVLRDEAILDADLQLSITVDDGRNRVEGSVPSDTESRSDAIVLTIDVTEVMAPPVTANPDEASAVVNNMGDLAITPDLLNAMGGSGTLTFNLVDAPMHGKLVDTFGDFLAGTSNTLANLLADGVAYRHLGNTTAIEDEFTFSITDSDTGTTGDLTFTVTINQAPTITQTGTLDLAVQKGTTDLTSVGSLLIADLNLGPNMDEDINANLTYTITGMDGSTPVTITPGTDATLTYGTVRFTRNNDNGLLTWRYDLNESDEATINLVAEAMAMEQIRVVVADRGMISGHDSTDLITTTPLPTEPYEIDIIVTGAPPPAVTSARVATTLEERTVAESGVLAQGDMILTVNGDDIDKTDVTWVVVGAFDADGNFVEGSDGIYGDLSALTTDKYSYFNLATTAEYDALDLAAGGDGHFSTGERFTDTIRVKGIQTSTGHDADYDIVIVITGEGDPPPMMSGPLPVNITSTALDAEIKVTEDLAETTVGKTIRFDDPDDPDGNESGVTIAIGGTSIADGHQHTTTFPGRDDVTIGKFTFQIANGGADGTVVWTYQLTDAGRNFLQALTSSEDHTDRVTLTFDDGVQATPTGQLIEVTISGADESGSIVITENNPITEGDANVGGRLTYQVNGNDDTPTSWGNPDGEGEGVYLGTYGQLTINANGTYTYVITNESNLDRDAPEGPTFDTGEELPEVFNITATKNGVTDAMAELTITIHGDGDPPANRPAEFLANPVNELNINEDTSGETRVGEIQFRDLDNLLTGRGITIGVVDGSSDITLAGPNRYTTSLGAFRFVRDDGGVLETPKLTWWYELTADLDSLPANDRRTDTLTLTITDGAADGSGDGSDLVLTVNIAGVNDEPVQQHADNQVLYVEFGGETLIDASFLEFSDVDTGATLTYTVTRPTNGNIYRDASDEGMVLDAAANDYSDSAVVTSFTQQDINENRITFRHDDSTLVQTSGAFNYELSDGGGYTSSSTLVDVNFFGIRTTETDADRTFAETTVDNRGTLSFSTLDVVDETIDWSGTHDGTFGSLVVLADGSYTYTPKSPSELDTLDTTANAPPGSANDGLGSFDNGEIFIETFSLMQTSGGRTSTYDLAFTIEGFTPVTADPDESSAVISHGEDLAITPDLLNAMGGSGTLRFNLVDAPMSLMYGKLVDRFGDFAAGTGNFLTNLVTDRVAYRHLGTDTDSITDTFTFAITDSASGTPNTTGNITFTVTINQAPTGVVALDEGTDNDVTENTTDLTASGTVTFTDLNTEDMPDTLTVMAGGTTIAVNALNERVDATYGFYEFSRTADSGEIRWTYTLDGTDQDTIDLVGDDMDTITITATDRGMISGKDSTTLRTVTALTSLEQNIEIDVTGVAADLGTAPEFAGTSGSHTENRAIGTGIEPRDLGIVFIVSDDDNDDREYFNQAGIDGNASIFTVYEVVNGERQETASKIFDIARVGNNWTLRINPGLDGFTEPVETPQDQPYELDVVVSDRRLTATADVTLHLRHNVAPTVPTNVSFSVEQGQIHVFNSNNMINLAAADADPEDNTEGNEAIVTYRITNPPTAGEIFDNTRGPNGTRVNDFTQADLTAGKIEYRAGTTAATSDRFTFSVEDELGGIIEGQTFRITLTAPADMTAPPTQEANKFGVILNTNTEGQITNEHLSYDDPDGNNDLITYTVTGVTGGTLWRDPTPNTMDPNNVRRDNSGDEKQITPPSGGVQPMNTRNTFTQADIDSGFIFFVGDVSGQGSFNFTVADESNTPPVETADAVQIFAVTLDVTEDSVVAIDENAEEPKTISGTLQFAYLGAPPQVHPDWGGASGVYTGRFGTLTITDGTGLGDGDYTYRLTDTEAELDEAAELQGDGPTFDDTETLIDTFVIKVQDDPLQDLGALTIYHLDITINGVTAVVENALPYFNQMTGDAAATLTTDEDEAARIGDATQTITFDDDDGGSENVTISHSGQMTDIPTNSGILRTYGNFRIDSLDKSTGELTWSYQLTTFARENLLNHLTTSSDPLVDTLTLTIRDMDGGVGAMDLELKVTIEGRNDAPTIAVDLMAGADGAIDENSTAEKRIGTITITDPDHSSFAASSIVIGGTNAGSFAARGDDGTSFQLWFTGATAFDFESNPTADLTFDVSDALGAAATQATASVTINEVNEIGTVAAAGGATATSLNIAENASTGATGMTFSVTGDPDDSSFTFTVTGDSRFAIMNDNELHYIGGGDALDYDDANERQITLMVSATDMRVNAGERETTPAQAITVDVTNVNDQAPTIDGGTIITGRIPTANINDNSYDFTDITFTGNDPDGILTTFTESNFELVEGSTESQRFFVDTDSSGNLFLQYLKFSNLTLGETITVDVYSYDGIRSATPRTITIHVGDEPVENTAPVITDTTQGAGTAVVADAGLAITSVTESNDDRHSPGTAKTIFFHDSEDNNDTLSINANYTPRFGSPRNETITDSDRTEPQELRALYGHFLIWRNDDDDSIQWNYRLDNTSSRLNTLDADDDPLMERMTLTITDSANPAGEKTLVLRADITGANEPNSAPTVAGAGLPDAMGNYNFTPSTGVTETEDATEERGFTEGFFFDDAETAANRLFSLSVTVRGMDVAVRDDSLQNRDNKTDAVGDETNAGGMNYGTFQFYRKSDGTLGWNYILNNNALDDVGPNTFVMKDGELVPAPLTVTDSITVTITDTGKPINTNTDQQSTDLTINVIITGIAEPTPPEVVGTPTTTAMVTEIEAPTVEALDTDETVTFSDVEDAGAGITITVGDSMRAITATTKNAVLTNPAHQVTSDIVNADGNNYGYFVFYRHSDSSIAGGNNELRWNYVVDNEALVYLDMGDEPITDTITLKLTDLSGQSPDNPITFSVTITGIDERPGSVVTSAATTLTGINEDTTTVSDAQNIVFTNPLGNLADVTIGIDGVETHQNIQNGDTYTSRDNDGNEIGMFTFSRDGAGTLGWTYELTDAGRKTLQSLGQGQDHTESITLVFDNGGLVTADSEATISFDIAGANDRAIVRAHGEQTLTILGGYESAGITDTGFSFTIEDPDTIHQGDFYKASTTNRNLDNFKIQAYSERAGGFQDTLNFDVVGDAETGFRLVLTDNRSFTYDADNREVEVRILVDDKEGREKGAEGIAPGTESLSEPESIYITITEPPTATINTPPGRTNNAVTGTITEGARTSVTSFFNYRDAESYTSFSSLDVLRLNAQGVLVDVGDITSRNSPTTLGDNSYGSFNFTRFDEDFRDVNPGAKGEVTWTYTVAASTFANLHAGEEVQDTITLRITDAGITYLDDSGVPRGTDEENENDPTRLTTDITFTVTIIGAGASPGMITTTDSLTTAENAMASGTFVFSLGSGTWKSTDGLYGTLTIETDGRFTYAPHAESVLNALDGVAFGSNNADGSFDFGEEFSDTITVTATDGSGNVVNENFTFTVTGVGDPAPEVFLSRAEANRGVALLLADFIEITDFGADGSATPAANITFHILSDGANGSFEFADGSGGFVGGVGPGGTNFTAADLTNINYVSSNSTTANADSFTFRVGDASNPVASGDLMTARIIINQAPTLTLTNTDTQVTKGDNADTTASGSFTIGDPNFGPQDDVNGILRINATDADENKDLVGGTRINFVRMDGITTISGTYGDFEFSRPWFGFNNPADTITWTYTLATEGAQFTALQNLADNTEATETVTLQIFDDGPDRRAKTSDDLPSVSQNISINVRGAQVVVPNSQPSIEAVGTTQVGITDTIETVADTGLTFRVTDANPADILTIEVLETNAEEMLVTSPNFALIDDEDDNTEDTYKLVVLAGNTLDYGTGAGQATSHDLTIRVTDNSGADNATTEITTTITLSEATVDLTGSASVPEGRGPAEGTFVLMIGDTTVDPMEVTWEIPDLTNGEGAIGILTIADDGTGNYTFAPQSELALNEAALADGRGVSLDISEHVRETFRVVGTAANGITAERNIEFIVTGTGTILNARDALIEDVSFTFTQDKTTGYAELDETATFSVVDHTGTIGSTATNFVTEYGTFSVRRDDANDQLVWNYTLGQTVYDYINDMVTAFEAVDRLADDVVHTDTITISDGTEMIDLSVNIEGTDDALRFGFAAIRDYQEANLPILRKASGSVLEDATHEGDDGFVNPGNTSPGTIYLNDPDSDSTLNATRTITAVLNTLEFGEESLPEMRETVDIEVKQEGEELSELVGIYGTFTFKRTDSDTGFGTKIEWTYTLDNNKDDIFPEGYHLNHDERITLTTEGLFGGLSIGIFIEGVNDPAVLQYAEIEGMPGELANMQTATITQGEANSGDLDTGIVFDITEADFTQRTVYTHHNFLVHESDGAGGYEDTASTRFAVRGTANQLEDFRLVLRDGKGADILEVDGTSIDLRITVTDFGIIKMADPITGDPAITTTPSLSNAIELSIAVTAAADPSPVLPAYYAADGEDTLDVIPLAELDIDLL